MNDLSNTPVSSILSEAQEQVETIQLLEEEDYEVFCEAQAYSPFEYKWRMKRISACIDESLEALHDLNDAMMAKTAESLPARFVRELVDSRTSSPTYDKCIVCGREIIDGQHEVDHSPLLNAMLK